MDQSRFKELIIVQLNNKSPAFYDLVQPKVHYCGDKSSIQSQMNRPRLVIITSLKLHFNIILQSSPGLPTGLFLSGLPDEIFILMLKLATAGPSGRAV